MAALQLYRQSAVGDTLSDALHEMVHEDKIPGDLATKVMAEVASLASAPCSGSLETPSAHIAIGSLASCLTHPARDLARGESDGIISRRVAQ